MSDGPTLDLSAASSAAMEKLSGNTESSTPSANESSGSSTPPQSGQPGQNVPEPALEVEFSPGKKEQVTIAQLKEWRDSGLRLQDYTKKTQEVAEMRRQAEQVYRAYQQIAQEREQLQEFFRDEENVLKLVAQQYGPQALQRLVGMLGGQTQQPQTDPTQPATIEQAQLIAAQQVAQLKQELARMQQEVGEDVSNRLQQLRDEQETLEHKKTLDPVVHQAFEDHPILSAVEGMEEIIRFKVFQLMKQTPPEKQNVQTAIEYFKHVAQDQAKKLEAKFGELNKQSVINKQKLVDTNIEPPGGSIPQAQPKKPMKSSRDIDWKALSAQADEYMKSKGRF